MTLRVIQAPTAYPVGVDQLIAQSNLTLEADVEASERGLIEGYIAAATQVVENVSGLRLIERQLEWTVTGFRALSEIPVWPLLSVDEITYDLDVDTIAVVPPDQWRVVTDCRPFGVYPTYGRTWPVPLAQLANVRLRMTAGYGDAAAVPAALRQAVTMLAAHFYEEREATSPTTLSEVPFGVKMLIEPLQFYV